MGWAPLDLVTPAPFDQPFYLRLYQGATDETAGAAQDRVTEIDWGRIHK